MYRNSIDIRIIYKPYYLVSEEISVVLGVEVGLSGLGGVQL